MTATIAGASLYKKVDWKTIDWKTANRNVGRLQARIVKATQEKLLNRVLHCDAAFFNER